MSLDLCNWIRGVKGFLKLGRAAIAPCPPSLMPLDQRFVSSTRNIEVLLSHTHSIVCDNDIGGLFLGCFKSCKMAAHNLKIHFNSLLMILHKTVSKMFRRIFSLIKNMFCDSNPGVFVIRVNTEQNQVTTSGAITTLHPGH